MPCHPHKVETPVRVRPPQPCPPHEQSGDCKLNVEWKCSRLAVKTFSRFQVKPLRPNSRELAPRSMVRIDQRAWLAQLVEHFLYTERVGGSSPSRGTIRGNSSTGRAPSFQVGCCGFKSRFSLHMGMWRNWQTPQI